MEEFLYLVHLFNSGGIVMYPLLILSLVTVAIGIERFFYFKANRQGYEKFLCDVAHAVNNKEWKSAEEVCQHYPIATSRIIINGLQSEDCDKTMKEAFEEQMTVESIGFRRHLDYLSATVTIAPLLGLLGTVVGMIHTFGVLDNGAGAAAVTGGVGEALIATATGLCVAIVAFGVYTIFDHQVDMMVTKTERLCVTVLNAKKRK